MRTIARFVTRPIGEGKSDLILGSFMASAMDALKPNTVYDISECLGELVIKEVGPSLISEHGVKDSPIRVTWAQSFEQVCIQSGKYLLISQKEYDQLRALEKKNNECDI